MKVIQRLDDTTITPFWLRPKNWVLLQYSKVSARIVSFGGIASGVGLISGLPTSPSVTASVFVAVTGGILASQAGRLQNKRQNAIKKFGTPQIPVREPNMIERMRTRSALSKGKDTLVLREKVDSPSSLEEKLFSDYETVLKGRNSKGDKNEILSAIKGVFAYAYPTVKMYNSLPGESKYLVSSNINQEILNAANNYYSMPKSSGDKNELDEVDQLFLSQMTSIEKVFKHIHHQAMEERFHEMKSHAEFLKNRLELDEEETVPYVAGDASLSLIKDEKEKNNLWRNFKDSYNEWVIYSAK
jgi:hypothetical protein